MFLVVFLTMLTKIIIISILCQNDTIYKEWLKFINFFKGEHAQIQFWSKFEITKCCGDLEHKVKANNFLPLNNVSLPV